MSLDIRTVRVPARLDGEAIAELRRAIGAAAPGGVIVLRGVHPATFCAGLDLSRLRDLDDTAVRAGLREYADLLVAIAESPVPVLAMVEGETFGGGVGIAAAADLVLATPDARFGLPEALHGFYPAIVFAALDLRLAPQRSRRLALQCESIDAAAALSLGLVDEIASTDALDLPVQRWARRLARATPDAVAVIRAHEPHRARFRASLDAGVEATAQALSRPEVRAAIAEALA